MSSLYDYSCILQIGDVHFLLRPQFVLYSNVYELVVFRFMSFCDFNMSSTYTFILLLNSLTLSMNDDLKEGFNGFSGLMQVLKRQQNYAEEQNYDEMSNSLYTIREYAASWQSAYALRRFDIYMESEATAKATGVKIDEKWAKMRASSLVLFGQ